MKHPKQKKVSFPSSQGDQFITVVRQRADAYFKQMGIHRFATTSMHIKVILNFLLGVFLYFSIIFQLFSVWILLGMSMLLGLVTGFIAVNLCHDCLHGSYSSNPKINRLLGYFYDFLD